MRYAFWVSIVCLIVLFPGLGATRLWDHDEGYFAGTAAEMHARGEWVVPIFNDEVFGHKPPWMYWMMMIGYRMFGVNEFGARFFSAVFGTATALLTYRLGSRLANARVGLLAALAVTSCLMFAVVARAATPDSYLVFFTTLALYIFATNGGVTPHSAGGRSPQEQASGPARLPKHWSSFAFMYAVMGLGVLTKGPVGVLLPMAVIGMFLLCTTPRREAPPEASRWTKIREALRPFGPVNFLRTVWRMRPFTAVGMVLLVAGPWYLAVGLNTNGTFLWEFFGVHHFQRFGAAMEGHSGPVYYYILAVLIGMFPWSIFTVPAALLWIQHLRKRNEDSRALVFITCWAGVYLVLFSLASTKLPNYVLPAYPALAISLGYFLDNWIRDPQQVRHGWIRVALGVLVTVALVAVILLPIGGLCEFGGQSLLDRAGLAKDVQHDVVWLGLTALPALLAAVAAFILVERGRIQAATNCVCLAAVVNMVCLWNVAAPRVERFQTAQRIARHIRQDNDGRAHRIAQFCYERPSMVFYAGNRIQPCNTASEVREFFSSAEPAYLITPGIHVDALKTVLPPDVQVVQRESRFPEKGEIVLLARQPILVGAAEGILHARRSFESFTR